MWSMAGAIVSESCVASVYFFDFLIFLKCGV
jgi:hypothetical protein